MNKKFLVTGGAGFIGSYVTKALIEAGNDVVIFDNLSTGRRERIHPKATFIEGDIRDVKALAQAVGGQGADGARGVDGIFHLAALPSVPYSIEHPEETNEINAQGTVNVLEVARITKNTQNAKGVSVPVVFSASSAVYGDQDTLPLTEDMTARPMSPYAEQKYASELSCTEYSKTRGVPTGILRYFNVYGTGQPGEGAYANVIAKFRVFTETGRPLTITGDGSQTRDFVHVTDIARANLIAMDILLDPTRASVISGIPINIGSGKASSVKEIAHMFGGEIQYIPARVEPKNSLADITRAKKLLGWEAKVSLEEGISMLIK